jgi:hypothetical protein
MLLLLLWWCPYANACCGMANATAVIAIAAIIAAIAIGVIVIHLFSETIFHYSIFELLYNIC